MQEVWEDVWLGRSTLNVRREYFACNEGGKRLITELILKRNPNVN